MHVMICNNITSLPKQSCYISKLKEDLVDDVAVALLDFAENYSFIVQDAVQGHH